MQFLTEFILPASISGKEGCKLDMNLRWWKKGRVDVIASLPAGTR
jgi:hypothetical protein